MRLYDGIDYIFLNIECELFYNSLFTRCFFCIETCGFAYYWSACDRNRTMLFKPNFCCNCGVKIERAEWSVLTSRRFCEVCAVENKGHDWAPRIAVIAGILAGVFGIGAYLGRPSTAEVPLKLAENEPARKLTVGAKQQLSIKDEERNSPQAQNDPATAAISLPNGAVGAEAAKDQSRGLAAEPVHYCGALTKKGKPCSRRVKTKSRCWQHTGQPSALVSQSAPDVY
jgi:hypothetical protein